MSVPIERTAKVFQFARRKRFNLSQHVGVVQCFGVLNEVDRIDQEMLDRFGDNHLTMGPDLQRLLLPQRLRERPAKSGIAHVTWIRVNGNTARPADCMVLDGQKRPVLNNRERRCEIIVEMRDSLNIRPGAKYLSVEVNFSRGANTFRTGHYDTIEITDQQVVRPQAKHGFDRTTGSTDADRPAAAH